MVSNHRHPRERRRASSQTQPQGKPPGNPSSRRWSVERVRDAVLTAGASCWSFMPRETAIAAPVSVTLDERGAAKGDDRERSSPRVAGPDVAEHPGISGADTSPPS